eukprot:jgi/Mesvir1/11453/Mv19783-RA.1
MLAIMSAVAVAGYLFRPTERRQDHYSVPSGVLQSIRPTAPPPNSLNAPMIPQYSSRGGYGSGNPDYVNAPNHTMGWGGDTPGMDLTVNPPSRDPRIMFAPGGYPRPSAYGPGASRVVDGGGIPGPVLTEERQPVLANEFTGEVGPDRVFEGEKTWHMNLYRERDARTAPDILNRKWSIPEPRLRVNRPNPQQAHMEQRDLPTVNARMMDVFLDTVLPERAALAAPNAHVSDAYNGFQGVGWAHLQTFSRPPPGKREALIDSLSAHPAPQGDADLPQLQIGAHANANHRGPLNPKTWENRFASAEFGNPEGYVRDQTHTHVVRKDVCPALTSAADVPDTRELKRDQMMTGRFPKLDEAELTAVRWAEADLTAYTDQVHDQGKREERPGRVGVADVVRDVTGLSAQLAYESLKENPYYIENANHRVLQPRPE